MILKDGNKIYSIFFFAYLKKIILKNLVELPINTTSDLKFSNGILCITENNNNCIPINK